MQPYVRGVNTAPTKLDTWAEEAIIGSLLSLELSPPPLVSVWPAV
ncbi:MAG: hypothetical protein WD696_05280 [Bryobacteraceae bacterium]